VPLILLFIVLPAVELGLLIEVGTAIGALPTVGLIVLTGVVGAALAKRQGLATLQAIRDATGRGEVPVDHLIDGAMILLAGALLVTPGILTDAFGFACLIPGTRQLIKRQAKAQFERAAARGDIHVVQVHGFGDRAGQPSDPRPGARFGGSPRGPVVDVEAPVSDDDPAEAEERERGASSDRPGARDSNDPR